MSESRPRGRTAFWWLFPLALWALATGFYGFDIGKFSDDWAYCVRTPETGSYEWPANPFIRWNYFWRPVHLLATYAMGTAFWRHDWIGHAISALSHLGVGVLIYRLVRRAGVGRGAGACAMCVFLVMPVSFEAVLWPSAIGSVTGVGTFLVAACVMMSVWQGPGGPGRGWRAGGLVVCAALGFLTACWHEQPAASVLALPALYLAVCPDGWRWPSLVRRGAPPIMAFGVGVAGYVALFVATVPSSSRGGTHTLVKPEAIGAKLVSLGEMTWNLLLGARARDSTRDALRFGVRAIHDAPAGAGAAAVAAVALLAVGWVWMLGQQRRESEGAAGLRGSARGRAWLAIFGLGMGLTSMLPIALVWYQPLWSRHIYGLGAGLAIALGVGLDAGITLLRRGSRGAATKEGGTVVLAAVASLAVLGAVCCVGWQSEFRARYLADADQLEQIRRLVPDPPEGAVFVPLALGDARPAGLRMFDPGVYGALAQHCSCWAYVQRGYARSDLSAAHLVPWQRPPVVASTSGVTYPRGFSDAWGRTSPDRTSVAWEKVIAIAVDGAGKVRIVPREEAIRQLGSPPEAPRPE